MERIFERCHIAPNLISVWEQNKGNRQWEERCKASRDQTRAELLLQREELLRKMQELKEKFISESRPEDHKKWRTDQDIRDAVKLWIDDQEAAVTKYGHMKEWETECVTDMSGLFDGCETFS